jgi:O-antigen/teichoic acid export membrane protein
MLAKLRHRLERSSVARRLVGGMFWTTINSAVTRALALASGIVLARIFGAADFGAYGMLQGTVGMFGALSGLGVALTATKYVAEYRQRQSAQASHIIALTSSVALTSGALFSLVLLALAKTLAVRVLAAPAVEQPLRLSALLLFFGNVWGAQAGVLSGFESFRRLAFVTIAGGVVSFAAAVGGGIWLGLSGAVGGLVLGNAVSCLLGHVAVVVTAKEHGVSLRLWGGKELAHLLWKFSIPATLAGIVVTPVSWACSAMLVNTPGGLGQVGLFNAANQWFSLVVFLPGLLGRTVIPILSERLGQNDARTSQRVLRMSILVNGVAAAAIALVVWLFSESVARLYGKGFEATPAVLRISVGTGVLLALQSPVGHVLTASGRMWVGFAMNLAWAICFLGFTQLLVHRGAVGLAEARLAAYVAHGVWTWWYAARVLRGNAVAVRAEPMSEPFPDDSNAPGVG